MQLKGYIQAFKENTFTIPVYGDGEFYYFHNLDDNFKIKEFYLADNIDAHFKSIYLSKKFEKGSIGAIVFVGNEDFVSYDEASKNIDEIIHYLTDTTISSKYLNIKKEALELRQILHKEYSEDIVLMGSSGNIKAIELKGSSSDIYVDYQNYTPKTWYTLEEYMQKENYITSSYQLNNFKETLIKKYLEKSIFDKSLYNVNKEVMFSLFVKYLDDNKSAFEQIIFDTNIGNDFSTYLSSINDVTISPVEISIEETLKMRADYRRKNLKLFNHYFHNSPSYIDEMSKVPAYKRLGVELNDIPSSEHVWPKMIISVETKDFKSEENEKEKVTKT